MSKSFFEKFVEVQRTISVPKGNFNSFGKYNYRSCEDILAALRDQLGDLGLFVRLEDKVELIGERYYIQATAIISDGEKQVSATAYARESLDKKGMDDSQITGTASSYARKYALSGLLGLDDEQDADTTDNRPATQDASRFNKSSRPDLASFVVPVGKYKGSRLGEIAPDDISSYCQWVVENSKKTNKAIDGDMKTMIDTSREFLRTIKERA